MVSTQCHKCCIAVPFTASTAGDKTEVSRLGYGTHFPHACGVTASKAQLLWCVPSCWPNVMSGAKNDTAQNYLLRGGEMPRSQNKLKQMATNTHLKQVFSIQAPLQLQAGKLAASVLRVGRFLIKHITNRAKKEQSNQHAEGRKLMPKSNTATRSQDTRMHICALGIEERKERGTSARNTTHNSSRASRHAH